MERVLVGEFGVDSGQVMIGDPCYINSNWSDKEFQDIRIYRKKHDPKQTLQFGVDFQRYDEMIPGHMGKCMNQLLQEDIYIEVPRPTDNSYSYNGACSTTINNNFGVLSREVETPNGPFQLGPLAVVSRTGYGDGGYEVYAYMKEGVVHKLEVIFIED